MYSNLYYTGLSIYKNYKWWISALLCLFVLNDFQINKQYIYFFLTFIFMMIYSHIFHYLFHIDTFYPINIIHVYHHSVSGYFSNILEVIFECIILFYPLMTFYLFNHYIKECNIKNKLFIDFVSIFSFWTILFYLGFYITMHNINYSILKVNHIHKIHHEELLRNMSPDVFDILFCRKTDPSDIENMDHMILNLYASLLFVIILKKLYDNHIFNDSFVTYLFLFFFIGKIIVISILFIIQTNYSMEQKLKYFKKEKIEKIEKKKKNKIGIWDYINKKIKRNLINSQPYLLFTDNLNNHY